METSKAVLDRTLSALGLTQTYLEREYDSLIDNLVDMAHVMRISQKRISVIVDDKETIVAHELTGNSISKVFVRGTPDANNELRHLLYLINQSIRSAA